MQSPIKTIVRQKDQSDCGVACLLTIIQYHQGTGSLENLRKLSGTSKQGTTLLGLYQAAQEIGFTPEGGEADTEWLKSIDHPVVLHVIIDKRLQHYVVCYGFKNDKFIIGDPARGLLEYTETELSDIWQSKALLTLVPNDQFLKKETVTKGQYEWIKNTLREDAPLLWVIFVTSLIVSVFGVSLAIFSQRLIDVILPEKDVDKLIIGSLLLLVLLLAKSGIGYLAGFFGITQAKQFNSRIIDDFFNSLLFLPKSFFDNRKIGELVTRLNDTGRIQNTISLITGDLLRHCLMILVGLTVVFTYESTIGFIILGSLPFFAYTSFRFHKKVVLAQQEVMAANAHKTSNYISSMQGIDSIKINNREPIFAQANQLVYGHFQQKVFTLGRLSISLQLIVDLIAVISIMGILASSSYYVLSEVHTVGTFTAILSISTSLFPSIATLSFANISLQSAKVAFDRMHEFTSIASERDQVDSKQLINRDFQKLIIKNVSFRFPGREQVLQNVSLNIAKGQIVGILGESGGGKTTLLNLIQRFYSPEGGDILYNEQSIDSFSLQSYRMHLGIVPQDLDIFNGTLMDNLILGGDEEEAKKCIEFCEEYGFSIYFKKFPQGYATILGEEGINISGGQKQLIGLCRALYKKPDILLLDEPTSAMDRNTEKFAIDTIKRISSNCGILVVTHQLRIANMANHIYVFKNGKIQTEGSQSSLLESDNLYSQIYADLIPPSQ